MHAHMHEAGRGRAVERGPVGDRVDIRREGERERGKEEKVNRELDSEGTTRLRDSLLNS